MGGESGGPAAGCPPSGDPEQAATRAAQATPTTAARPVRSLTVWKTTAVGQGWQRSGHAGRLWRSGHAGGARPTLVAGGMLAVLVAVGCGPAGERTAERPPGALSPVQTILAQGDPEAVPAAAEPPGGVEAKVVVSPAGVVVPVLGREGGSWRVSTPCGREATLAAGSVTRLDRATVVIDPGHGGYDPGAVGHNGLTEAALNLAVSQHAKAVLEAHGISVVLTRSADHGMNLANRARLALSLEAKAFVSIHHNAAATARSRVPGSEAFHQVDSEESKRLAGLIYEEIVAALMPYDLSWVNTGMGVTWRTRANGEDYYAMVRQPKGIPATLAELAYISNPAEANLLARPDVQRVEGEAVARGILRFLTTDDPGSGFVEGGPMPPRPRTGRGGGGGEDPCDDPAL